MRQFYQTEWFNIKFESFTELDAKNIADEEFYTKFYKQFFKKFNSYSDLPNDWKEDKNILANFIFSQIKNKTNVLSVGCGNGFIENQLSNMKWGGE